MEIFISSSSESKYIAEYIAEIVSNINRATPKPWFYSDVFKPGDSFIQVLENMKENVSGAIMVFSEDDKIYFRGREYTAVRDNILIEYGLFTGELGRNSVLVIVHGQPKIPLNIEGMVVISVEKGIDKDNFRAQCTPRINDWYNDLRATRRRKLEIVEMQKEVFAYVFNKLNPYQNISLTIGFLKDLPTSTVVNQIGDVLFPLDRLMHNYVGQFVEDYMRVYFVYRLEVPKIINSIEYQFKIAISYSKNENNWLKGYYVLENSNIGKVYSQGSISVIRDAQVPINTLVAKNLVVNDEGSVVAFPVLFVDGEKRASIGVVGISSPNKKEVADLKYQNLIQELSIIFSSLFYAYGRVLLREAGFDTVVNRIRAEIDSHF